MATIVETINMTTEAFEMILGQLSHEQRARVIHALADAAIEPVLRRALLAGSPAQSGESGETK